ncbi:MAG: hypothetical protein ACKV22_24965 [Bryobacteraceae bacterium]
MPVALPTNLTSRWIDPEILLSQVRNTAPFLGLPETPVPSRSRFCPLGAGPEGFLSILHAAGPMAARTPEEDLEDYFALCLACHHATVATFVPTDVDSKIRGHLWQETRSPEALRHMCDLAIQALEWDLSGVSRRAVTLDANGPVSGHNGEMLSVLAGAHGRFLEIGDAEYAGRTAGAIDRELQREAAVFEAAVRTPGREIDLLKLSASITHNLGDLDQGIGYWKKDALTEASRRRFHRLAHENSSAYAGAFQRPAALYREAMAAEGHRHYPLRGVRSLRQSADLLLPISPFLDEWGATVATHPCLRAADRAEALAALVTGCRKVANQAGYYRAIAGFAEGSRRNFEEASGMLPNAASRELRTPEFRKRVAVSRRSFESALAKKARGVVDGYRSTGQLRKGN